MRVSRGGEIDQQDKIMHKAYYYTIRTPKRAITPIDEYRYPALLHSLKPGWTGFWNELLAMLFAWKIDQINCFVLKY